MSTGWQNPGKVVAIWANCSMIGCSECQTLLQQQCYAHNSDSWKLDCQFKIGPEIKPNFQEEFWMRCNITYRTIEHIMCKKVPKRGSYCERNNVTHIYMTMNDNENKFIAMISQWVINYHQHNYHQQKMAAASSGKEQQSAISLFLGLPDSCNLHNI